MKRFTQFIAIDWSGAKGPVQKGIAVARCTQNGPPVLIKPGRGWSRLAIFEMIKAGIGSNTLVGMDLGISLPFADAGAFFPGWDESPNDAKQLWALIDRICSDDPHLECGSFVSHPEAARYFRHSRDHVGDRFHLPGAVSREGRFRAAEIAQRQGKVRPVSNFNLVGAAQVGKSSLTGMRMLNRLRDQVAVWPIDAVSGSGPVLVEMYTSIAARAASAGNAGGGTRTKLRTYEDLNAALDRLGSPPVVGTGPIDDHSSDALITAAWLRNAAHNPALWSPAGLTSEIAQTEGWTFGAA